MTISVFTPTYNRVNLLNRVYDSLASQTFKDFEWIIVDDGSVDKTNEIVQQWIIEDKIKIQYFRQNNRGKHIAINKGLTMAKGDLFFILDSDDYLSVDALDSIDSDWQILKTDANFKEFCGLGYNRIHNDGTVIGGNVNYDTLDADIYTYRYKLKVNGDKAEVFITNILIQYPFPDDNNEKFCPEALVWNRLGNTYKVRYKNKGIYICEYLPNGLTDTTVNIRKKSPLNITNYYAELANKKISAKQTIRAILNFWRFSFYNTSETIIQKSKKINYFWAIALYPISFIFFLKDKKK